MTAKELEDRLKAQGGPVWGQYKRRKEGFITRVVEDNFVAGKRVRRCEAQEIWFRKVEREMIG